MPRWQPDGADRLRLAAFELFEEQGFDQTTVSAIARRAGLTERSFFNHFRDKREVLFSLSTSYERAVVDAIADEPPGVPAMAAAVNAMRRAAVELFGPRREAVLRRQALIATSSELQEREVAKGNDLVAAVTDALRQRGVGVERSRLAAGAALLVQVTAFRSWVEEGEQRTLDDLFRLAVQEASITVQEALGALGADARH